jgi:DNA-binding CsgD family transcriptional regulator
MHLSRAYRKLGIRTRWQLAELAGRRNGEAVGAR